jgi:uncharacterized protein (TIGR00299 family) protein
MRLLKIAYVDCFSGASGDMFLGALFQLGYSPEQLRKDLAGVNVHGYEVGLETRVVSGISSIKAIVEAEEEHVHRHLEDIVHLIRESDLKETIKAKGIELFTRLATAEAKVHHTTLDKVHFHEVGAVDSIVDILGTLCGIDYLQIEEMYCGSIPLGCGFVECQHGTIPVPAPATLELLKGYPVYQTDIEAELVTPTGALLLTSLCKFEAPPHMRITHIGYGAGTRVLESPNLLRLYLGEKASPIQWHDLPGEGSSVVAVEVTIDDMNPEFYEYVLIKLQEAGALEAFLTPIMAKKSRPATLLTVIASPSNVEPILQVMFRETTTLGVRLRQEKMYGLSAEKLRVDMDVHHIGVKIARIGQEVVNIAPEYEECKQVAQALGLPLKDVYDGAKEKARKKIAELN